MKPLSFILSALGFAGVTAANLTKGKRMTLILLFLFFANVCYALSYLTAGGGINGAYSCLLGSILVVNKSFYDRRSRKLPIWLTGLYTAAFIVLNIWLSGISLPALLMIGAALTFLLSVLQESGAAFRLWTTANVVCWCIYDTVTGSYGALTTHIVMLCTTLFGIILHDIPRKTKT